MNNSVKEYNPQTGIIELPDGYIINGFYYDKMFTPIDRQYSLSETNYFCVDKSSLCNGGAQYGVETDEQFIRKDNMSYFILNNTQIWSYNHDTYELKKFYENTTRNRPYQLVDIDNNYLYVVTKSDAENYRTIICKIKIDTSALTVIHDYDKECSYTNYLYSDENFIYYKFTRTYSNYWTNGMSEFHNQGMGVWLYKYNKQNNSEHLIYTLSNADSDTFESSRGSRGAISFQSNGFLFNKRNNNKWFLFKVVNGSLENNYNPSTSIYITNRNNDQRYDTSLDITYNQHHFIKYWDIDNNVFILRYNQNQNADDSNFYKYDTDAQKLTNIHADPDHRTHTVILSEDNSILIMNELNQSNIWIYDQENKTYKKVTQLLEIEKIGIDSLNRIWYKKTYENTIYCEDLADPNEVQIIFEKPLYTYTDTDIETYLNIRTKNIFGEQATGRYVLTLSNNAYFTESNSQRLELDYQNDTVKYPFKITAKGTVKCTVMYQKIWSK